MKKFLILISIIIPLLFSSCGKGTVQAINASYEPKIVIEGFLHPHQKVSEIRINRNFRVNANLQRISLIPDPDHTEVEIIDEASGNRYPLTFTHVGENYLENYYYEYTGNDLLIDYGKEYTLEVHTRIEGKELSARSTTRVPQPGFQITAVNHQSLPYYYHDEQDGLVNFKVTINRSPGITFYTSRIRAMDASVDSFIYDNVFMDLKPKDVEEDLVGYANEYDWIMDTPDGPGETEFDLHWYSFNFYGQYEIIIYACDKNYMEFLMTYNDVQEDDGNFHEAKFNIEGDGIGVFGSVIADTLYLNVME